MTIRLKPKYYLLYSDRKTVRELTIEEWRRIFSQDLRSKKSTHLLAEVFDTEVYFHKDHGLTIHRQQLKQILGDS